MYSHETCTDSLGHTLVRESNKIKQKIRYKIRDQIDFLLVNVYLQMCDSSATEKIMPRFPPGNNLGVSILFFKSQIG